ncbi:Eco57I restriction-modification methylase domain-containing protein [uncultured Draconibacterium sp.]|uniref:type IIG restriction enzyme/methyltransferase n=1 Tax=uncultured Draconibacterium sp. TaxID=1573823 RepID=UPI002AA81356|nr:Eco57I restriction-modification methylase domain-containing protein [uncultured Draconibacterium sp.]
MTKLNTRKALNPAYRKHKPLRKDVNSFIDELLSCLKEIKEIDIKNESEEHIKEPIKTFFKNTFYEDNYINTKGNIDLAIYLGKNLSSEVGVIIETKKPSNKSEFLLNDNLNRKALHELLLYYLRERIDEKNNNIKHLIATNGYEWYLFKSEDFYRLFYKNRALVKEYEDFRDGKKDSSKNELFYNEIAKKYIAEIEQELPFVYLDFTKKSIKTYSDSALNTLYKIFSDVHFLGAAFGNDSNKLNKTFYNELLHIIGLEEIKEKGKKLIQRKAADKRDYGSILENAIFIIEDRDYLNNIKSLEKGENKAFNAGLDLTLTWINRILFLKLLESQLLSYHGNANEYRFLNSDFIKGFDDLNDLFFSALAKQPEDRHPKYRERFQYIPYLNSSLFERSVLENEAFTISSLNDDKMPVFSQTVLKNVNGKRLNGKLNTLDYLFRFLDAYNFSTDGTEGIEDDNESKTLINASVLGLIFEKINGYKEGSFYTPAYITMYMSRETIRRAIVHKFRDMEDDQIETFDDLKAYTNRFFKTDDLKRFNKIVNSIRIVDPAVGSGHFLVSALNEIIGIKSELHILVDENGNSLRSEIIVENDELYITDEHGHLLDYKPGIKETALIQKTLFHEKQNIIENSLFGVDINPNSVKICRLRLWIELLKNAYYTDAGQLQTLPNIDINIKAGNSLISRFALTDDLKDAFKGKNVNYNFDDYKNAVAEYKNTNDKKRKHEVLEIIKEVKSNFQSTLDKKFILQNQRDQEAYVAEKQRLENLKLFNEKIKKAEKDNLKLLKQKAEKSLSQKEEIVNNVIYHNAFEWRFEFPEVLNEKGDYIGFDVVIGNPPYFSLEKSEVDYFAVKHHYNSIEKRGDIYTLFYEQGMNILRELSTLCFITSSTWMRSNYGKSLRGVLIDKYNPWRLIDFSDYPVFDSATVLTNVLFIEKSKYKGKISACLIEKTLKPLLSDLEVFVENKSYEIDTLGCNAWSVSTKEKFQIRKSVERDSMPLKSLGFEISNGFRTGLNEAYIINEDRRRTLISKDPKSAEIIKPLLRGRDIRKYDAIFGKQYVIVVAHGKGASLVHEYPEIYDYLLGFEKKLKKRGQVKNGQHHWLELDNHPSQDYLMLFEEKKIIYPEITKFLPFFLDGDNHYFSNNKTFFINGKNLESLVAFLNSKLFRYVFLETFPELQGNSRELRKVFMEQIPFKPISFEIYSQFKKKVDQIIAQKQIDSQANTCVLEAEIDQMVYELYELTEEEIKIVEREMTK